MPGKIGMATVGRVAIATQFVSATDGIDCSIFSDWKEGTVEKRNFVAMMTNFGFGPLNINVM